MNNLKIVLLVVIGAVLLYIKWLQSKNEDLGVELKKEQQVNIKTVEIYESNKRIEEKILEAQVGVENNKKALEDANTKLKVEIAKRDILEKEQKNEKNQISNDDDFVVISF